MCLVNLHFSVTLSLFWLHSLRLTGIYILSWIILHKVTNHVRLGCIQSWGSRDSLPMCLLWLLCALLVWDLSFYLKKGVQRRKTELQRNIPRSNKGLFANWFCQDAKQELTFKKDNFASFICRATQPVRKDTRLGENHRIMDFFWAGRDR